MQNQKPRVLIFSHRNISQALYHCPHYEFEDVVCQIDDAQLLAPRANLSTLRYNLAKRVAYHLPVTLNLGIQLAPESAQYDLFFAICGHPPDLLMIDAALDWRRCCKTSVCLIDECWIKEIPAYRSFFRILNKFDVVMLYYSQSVGPVGKLIRPKSVYLPPGIDTLLFNPYPQSPERSVDVYSIGRRAENTHQTLLNMAANSGLFYQHDSIAGGGAFDWAQHRALFANIAKRSRYFIVNPGLIDRPDVTGGQSEIGNRYFEGAASGAIMIGERPKNQEFERLFGWPDALIHLPYDSDAIDRVIHDLDQQPERQERIHRTNVAQAMLRHDWAYRWESILATVGLRALPQLSERKEYLRSFAEALQQENGAGCLGTEHPNFMRRVPD